MGPTWGRKDPGGPQVGPINLAIRVSPLSSSYHPAPGCLQGASLFPICAHFEHRVMANQLLGFQRRMVSFLFLQITKILIQGVSAVYGVNSWGTTIRFMTCRAALQRFRDFTKLSCAAGPRFRKPFLSWRESRALPLKFVQSRYGLGQHCMCNNVVAHLWFWPSFVTVFVVLMLCVKAHSLSNLYSVLLGFMYPVSVYFWVFCRTMKMDI